MLVIWICKQLDACRRMKTCVCVCVYASPERVGSKRMHCCTNPSRNDQRAGRQRGVCAASELSVLMHPETANVQVDEEMCVLLQNLKDMVEAERAAKLGKKGKKKKSKKRKKVGLISGREEEEGRARRRRIRQACSRARRRNRAGLIAGEQGSDKEVTRRMKDL